MRLFLDRFLVSCIVWSRLAVEVHLRSLSWRCWHGDGLLRSFQTACSTLFQKSIKNPRRGSAKSGNPNPHCHCSRSCSKLLLGGVEVDVFSLVLLCALVVFRIGRFLFLLLAWLIVLQALPKSHPRPLCPIRLIKPEL